MKLNNKGFAITGILYGLLILFALLVGSYLTILTAKKNRLDGIVADIENEYNNKENISTYTLTITKGTGVSEIHYTVDSNNSSYTSDERVLLSVNSGSTYSYYGVASYGYTMDDCTSSSPCNRTMGKSDKIEELTASAVENYTVTIKKSVDNAPATIVEIVSVSSGDSYSTTISGGSYYTFNSVSCTPEQTATIEEIFNSGNQVDCKFKISSVTSNTTCTVKISS